MNGKIAPLMTAAAIGAFVICVGAAPGLTQEREDRDSGAYLYRVFCIACHGDYGKGDGPVADTLRRSVPDLTVLSRAAGGVFPRDRVLKAIQTGGPAAAHVPGGMPSWGEAFARLDPRKGTAEKRIEALVDHVESLQAKE
jgi:mono/diheme cytochrome c family protein